MGRGGQRVSEFGYLGRIPGPSLISFVRECASLDESALFC